MKHNAFMMHMLVALALILSGVSPACHFISGKTSFIEICQSDGSVAKVEVPADYDPFAKETPEPAHKPKAQKQCNFCFFQNHMAKDAPAPPPAILAIKPLPDLAAIGAGILYSHHNAQHQPRGPPYYA